MKPVIIGVLAALACVGGGWLWVDTKLNGPGPTLYLSGECQHSEDLASDEQVMAEVRRRGWKILEIDGVQSASLQACAQSLHLGALGARLCTAHAPRAKKAHRSVGIGAVPMMVDDGQKLIGGDEIREALTR